MQLRKNEISRSSGTWSETLGDAFLPIIIVPLLVFSLRGISQAEHCHFLVISRQMVD